MTYDPSQDSYRGNAKVGEHSNGRDSHVGVDPLPDPLPDNPAGGKVKLTSQEHHIIPNKLTESASLFLKDLGSLYDHSSFKYNGVHLANDADASAKIGAARHNGSHPAYNEFVSRMVDEIKAEHDTFINNGGDEIEAGRSTVTVHITTMYSRSYEVSQPEPVADATGSPRLTTPAYLSRSLW